MDQSTMFKNVTTVKTKKLVEVLPYRRSIIGCEKMATYIVKAFYVQKISCSSAKIAN